MLIVHNERGHDSIEAKGYDGEPVFNCTLYPGLTCQQHCDAAVDVDGPRDEFLVKVPFITLCPNSWLVPPVGEPVQIEEEHQFVVAKVKNAVTGMQKTLGETVSKQTYEQVKNAVSAFDSALEDDEFSKALQALANVEGLVKKPHAALRTLVTNRLAELDDPVRWAFEDFAEPGSKDETPLATRVAGVRSLVKTVDVSIYGASIPSLQAMKAWLDKQAKTTGAKGPAK